MIKVIVVDDEWYNLMEVCDLIQESNTMEVIKKYQNPLEVLEEIGALKPDVAFIDIEMPEVDGITLAEKILEECPDTKIVFVTSWNQYAVQAFDLNAVDYIMKPIRKERFQKMIEKIMTETSFKKVQKTSALQIKCFGKLDTFIDGGPVKWERAKAEELFAFLLMNHGSYIHKDTILETLWPGYEPLRALPILQTSICRIRNVFAGVRQEILLNYSGSKYCLTIRDAECDYLEVEQALKEFKKEDRKTVIKVEKAFVKYDKGFFTQQGYIWSLEKDEELKKRFIYIFKELVEMNQIEEKEADQIKYLKNLSLLQPYDDESNYRLIQLLKKDSRDVEARNHYQWLCGILKEEYDTEPSEKIARMLNR